MVGTASSGNRPKTVAERIAKVNAARQAAGMPAVATDPTKRVPRGRLATIDDYDDLVGPPLSWADVKKREEALAVLEEARRRRGELISRKDAEDGAAEVYNTFVRMCDQLPVTVVQLLNESLDMDARAKVRTAVQTAWDKIIEQVGKKGTKVTE